MQSSQHVQKGIEPITFACEGKCRICPYPGANCKTISLNPDLPEREADPHRIWMDPGLQDQLMKQHRLK